MKQLKYLFTPERMEKHNFFFIWALVMLIAITISSCAPPSYVCNTYGTHYNRIAVKQQIHHQKNY